MPGPADFAEICRKIVSDSKITKQIENQYLDSEEISLLPGIEQKRLKCEAKQQFKKISKNITSKTQTDPGITEKSSAYKHINIYEYTDKQGEPQSYMAYGHQNKDHFKAEVWRQYSGSPYLINNIWMSDQKAINRDINGNANKNGVVSIFGPCNQNRNGAIEVTIGFLR